MEFDTPPGTRDFLPEEMAVRQEVMDRIKSVFELYGFRPAETPAFEYAEVLEGKYGEEEKLIYKFEDMGGRKLALRYDLTVPLVRLFAQNQLRLPFKRYCISRVWRFDRPQKGRYREFWQCDVDIVGSSSFAADVEIVSCAIDALCAIGLKDFSFKINSRKVLDSILQYLGIRKDVELTVFRALDKLEKIGEKKVRSELAFLADTEFAGLMDVLRLKDVSALEERIGTSEGTYELKQIFDALCERGKKVVLDLGMVRGLDYYSGPIFEVSLGDCGSIAGGGRYDRLIGDMSGKDSPAVGISLGIERIMEIVKDRGLFKGFGAIDAYVLSAEDESLKEAEKLCCELREEDICCEYDVMGRNFSNQMKYASGVGAKKVVIVGKRGLSEGKVTLKDMISGNQVDIERKKLSKELKGALRSK